jgi:Leucine Rich repeat
MGAVVLANALKQNTGLRELHIKGNELGDSGTTAICDALKGTGAWTCRCHTFHSRHKVVQHICPAGILLLAVLLTWMCLPWYAARKVGMFQLDMGNNSMTAEGAASLASYMEAHRELKELNLYMNDIGSAGLEKVVFACCCAPALTRASGSGWLHQDMVHRLVSRETDSRASLPVDCIGNQRQQAFGSPRLGRQQHHSRWCQGKQDRTFVWASMLPLRAGTFHLAINLSASASMKQMLMEALEECNSLRTLELGYNPFGEEGIKAIADVMKYKLQVGMGTKPL